jgi:hypothetical protein
VLGGEDDPVAHGEAGALGLPPVEGRGRAGPGRWCRSGLRDEAGAIGRAEDENGELVGGAGRGRSNLGMPSVTSRRIGDSSMRPASQAPSRPCRVDRRCGVVLTAPILGAGPSPGGDARRAGRFGFHGWRARCLSSSSPIHGARRAGNPRRRTEGPSERGPSAARETPFFPSRASCTRPGRRARCWARSGSWS